MKNTFLKLVVGCDHAACDLKAKVIAHLQAQGYAVTDVGTYTSDSCNYPDYAHAACAKILICGTGIGMSMAANKHRGIRAAVCSDTFSARLTREHNDANVLCFGARVVGEGLALDLVDAYLDAEFMGGKHQSRVALITAIETSEANA